MSHSKRHTRHKFKPNIHTRRIWSTELKKFISIKVSASAIRTIDKLGIDQFAKKVGVKLK